MAIWVVSTFWLIGIMLLCTFVYKFLCGHRSLFLLGLYIKVEFLDHMVILCLTIWRTARLFSKAAAHFIFLPAAYKGFSFSTSWPTLVILIIAIFIGAQWHLSAVVSVFNSQDPSPLPHTHLCNLLKKQDCVFSDLPQPGLGSLYPWVWFNMFLWTLFPKNKCWKKAVVEPKSLIRFQFVFFLSFFGAGMGGKTYLHQVTYNVSFYRVCNYW